MECTICLNDLNGCCKQLRCGHMFHKECIHTWFNTNKSCPTCRNEIFEIKTEKQLDDEWYKHKSNEYTETIEHMFVSFEEELEEYEIVEIRRFLLNTLYDNLSDFEYFFKKFIKLCDYLNEDLLIEDISEVYDWYGYAFEMMKRYKLYEKCETESIINFNLVTHKIIRCW